MNQVPPGQNEPDDVDDLYRRASAGDDSRPSEWVRSSVLTHAAHLAAERSRQKEPAGIASRRTVSPTWRRPAIFGTLAAAALAGLLIAPHFLPPPAPRVTAALQAPATPAPQAVPSRAARSRTPAEERSSGLLADQRPPPAAPAEEQKLGKAAGASVRNAPTIAEATSSAAAGNAAGNAADSAAASADSAPSLAAKNAPALVAGRVSAQRAAAAPMAETAYSANPAAELRQAAETGDAPKLQQLLGQQSDVDARDASGRTALLLAVLRGQAAAVDMLLAHGADPNAADANGNTPLKAATEGHQPAIAAALRRAGAR